MWNAFLGRIGKEELQPDQTLIVQFKDQEAHVFARGKTPSIRSGMPLGETDPAMVLWSRQAIDENGAEPDNVFLHTVDTDLIPIFLIDSFVQGAPTPDVWWVRDRKGFTHMQTLQKHIETSYKAGVIAWVYAWVFVKNDFMSRNEYANDFGADAMFAAVQRAFMDLAGETFDKLKMFQYVLQCLYSEKQRSRNIQSVNELRRAFPWVKFRAGFKGFPQTDEQIQSNAERLFWVIQNWAHITQGQAV
jgi:hypothetical protein